MTDNESQGEDLRIGRMVAVGSELRTSDVSSNESKAQSNRG